MDGYWTRVILAAWTDTKQPFSFSKKTAAAILTGLGTILVAGLRGDLSAMTSSIVGYFWLALAPFLAALVLFVWNIIETQANIYAYLAQTSAAAISKLETQVSKYTGTKPNYTAVRLQHQYPLGEASRLWCDRDPNLPANRDSEAWYDTFVSAIQRGQLSFQPRKPRDRDMVEYEQQHPDWSTIVTKEALKSYAVSIGEDPPFLRDS